MSHRYLLLDRHLFRRQRGRQRHQLKYLIKQKEVVVYAMTTQRYVNTTALRYYAVSVSQNACI